MHIVEKKPIFVQQTYLLLQKFTYTAEYRHACMYVCIVSGGGVPGRAIGDGVNESTSVVLSCVPGTGSLVWDPPTCGDQVAPHDGTNPVECGGVGCSRFQVATSAARLFPSLSLYRLP